MESIAQAKKQARKISREQNIKVKAALNLVAKNNHFSNWSEYRKSLDTFWYNKASPFLNHWFATHNEAVNYRTQNSGYLLTYKGQYFVADTDYIQFLEIDPQAEIWSEISYDVSSSNSFDKMYDYLKDQGLIS